MTRYGMFNNKGQNIMIKLIIVSLVSLALGMVFGLNFRDFLDSGDDGIQWQLNDAARRGDINEMKRFISKGANPLITAYDDVAGLYGCLPLSEAASTGEPEATEFLIAHGAGVNTIEATETPLDMAWHRKSQAEKTVAVLLAHGAKSFSEIQNPSEFKSQLVEKHKQLKAEASALEMREHELQSEISAMEAAITELKPKLERLDAEKKQMFEDGMKLKKRWERETEGIHEAPSRPIHELFRDMTHKVDQLLQENQELKLKLEAAGK